MSARKSSSINRWLKASIGFALVTGLGGCVEYVKRRDTVTLGAGDAQAWNRVVLTADPWPPYVMNTHIPGDGQRTAGVIQRYSRGNGRAGAAPAPAEGAAEGANGPAQ